MALEQSYRVLVTGGSGFLGRNVVKMLLAKYPCWTIDVLDLHPPEKDLVTLLGRFIQADIRSKADIDLAFEGYHPDLVLHTAGIVPGRRLRYSTNDKDWQRVKAVNIDGTKNIVDATLASGCTRFVYTSSVTAIIDDLEHDYHNMDETTPTGRAKLHYGKSKGIAEAYVLSPEHAEKGLKACALRPCTIIGPDDTQVISLIHDLIGKGETGFIVGDGLNVYDWMYIDNAAYAHVLAAENLLSTQTAAGEAFFISNQEPAYFWDFLAAIWAQFGHVPRYRFHIPVALAFVAAFVLELITWLTGKPTTLDRGSIKDGIMTQYASNNKAIKVLGYRPLVGLSEGLRRSCDGYKRQLATKAAEEKGQKLL